MPTLYLCIPKSDPAQYEQEGVSRDADKLRDYVVQGKFKLTDPNCRFADLLTFYCIGELLTYFVVVNFDSFRKEQAGCT